MSDYSEATPLQSTFVVGSSRVKITHNHPDASRELAITIAQAASDRKAGNIVLLGVTESYVADYFVMVTGYSRVQVRAIAGAIVEEVEQEWQQRRPLRSEGQAEGSWLVLDYGDVIVHIMTPKEREFYNLEAFWGHAERIDFPTSVVNGELAP